MTLKVPATNDILIYELRGICTAPLGETHLHLKCKTKEQRKMTINLRNTNDFASLKYRVETDIPNFFGPEEIEIESNTSKDYEFVIRPTISGKYLGCITFYEIG